MKYTIITCILILYGAVPAAIAKTPSTEYFRNMPQFWGQLYGKGGETLYCGQSFGPFKGRGINIEHVFPMGWVAKDLNCGKRSQCRTTSAKFNRIEADMHNLYPARAKINKTRSSYAYGIIQGELRRFGRCDFEIDQQKRLAEPRPEVRGNIARAMLYMHTTYDLKLFSRQGKLLIKWHRNDPPDREEQRRNRIIEHLQGVHNPFIDNPGLADNLRF
ncbi:hypothetical protein MNBD_GAMMA26-437 [hydrothermal vent metagenome]|uniref:Endonuclease I n=1 Tax=hydrothermal vent metagenome TaxID=652676 RepID=A0A3B1BPU1_9ZZZZ